MVKGYFIISCLNAKIVTKGSIFTCNSFSQCYFFCSTTVCFTFDYRDWKQNFLFNITFLQMPTWTMLSVTVHQVNHWLQWAKNLWNAVDRLHSWWVCLGTLLSFVLADPPLVSVSCHQNPTKLPAMQASRMKTTQIHPAGYSEKDIYLFSWEFTVLFFQLDISE